MLARTHVKTTASVGVAAVAAGLVPVMETKVAIVAGALFLAGSLLPDLDQASATASTSWILFRPRPRFTSETGKSVWQWTRQWWPGTPWISWAVRQWSLLMYRATRDTGDKPDAGAHRTFTHTAVGCAAIGGAVAWGMSQLPQWGAAVVVALLAGIVGQAFGRWWKWVVAVPVGVVAWAEPSLTVAWPVWAVAVALGCALHCAGDGCSRQGVPWRWPLRRGDRRWAPSHVLPGPLRFVTGGWGERAVLALVYAAAAGVVWPAVAPSAALG